MFYERRRKEVLTSTTEASRKVEGDRHSKGQSIDDLKVHTQVFHRSVHVGVHIYTYTHINYITGGRRSVLGGFK